MDAAEAEAKAELASSRYLKSREQADLDRETLVAAYADAVKAGSTPEKLAENTAFTAADIRQALRDRGL